MSDNGWIKLHRQIRNNWIWEDAEMLRAWLDILLMVNHEDKRIYFNGELITIKRGEKLTSILKLSDRWGWSRNRVKRFLDLLEADEMCTTNRTTNGTTLKVLNYAEYQSFYGGKRITNDTTNDTTDVPPLGPTDGPQTITNKNYKNDKREGQAPRSFSPPSRQDIEAYCHEKNYCMDTQLFIDYYDARNWTLGKGQKMSNWKSAVNAWVRRERSSVPADGITDKQAKVSYERTMQRIEDMNKDAEASKGYDPSELLNKARLKLAGGEA